MPTYEYLCDGCGERFERRQRITAEPITECPSCDARRVRRLISASSFQLKGSGWYLTDYSRKGGSSGDSSTA
jgi:putative FmdB family regulatory protein